MNEAINIGAGRTPRIRPIPELLKLMKDHIDSDMFFLGLCGFVKEMKSNSLINWHELAFVILFIQSELPVGDHIAGYAWQPCELSPRVKWLDEQIEKYSKKET